MPIAICSVNVIFVKIGTVKTTYYGFKIFLHAFYDLDKIRERDLRVLLLRILDFVAFGPVKDVLFLWS
jgi:hypothetical protein